MEDRKYISENDFLSLVAGIDTDIVDTRILAGKLH